MTSMRRGQSLELYFIDGRPDGMLTAEVFNWTGHVLVTPRTRLVNALARPEASHTGVYLLFGENEHGSLAYIGEGESISQRIKNHDANKDWWTSAVLITSTGNNLNKAHVKYLEARLIEQARTVGKVPLENGNTPARPSLTEAARANMENFLEYVFMLLPALRIDCFLANTRPASSASGRAVPLPESPEFSLETPRHGISAVARLEDGDFVVLAGSHARAKWSGLGSENSTYGKLFAELVETGVLGLDGGLRVFLENYAFKSPSAAAAVINGRPTNGTLAWKVRSSGKTYKEWESEKLGSSGDPE